MPGVLGAAFALVQFQAWHGAVSEACNRAGGGGLAESWDPRVPDLLMLAEP